MSACLPPKALRRLSVHGPLYKLPYPLFEPFLIHSTCLIKECIVLARATSLSFGKERLAATC